MQYYIFTDIDGTIRIFDGTVLPSTRKAIHDLRAAGHKVLICSGRPEGQIEPYIREIGFDGVISAGGARLTYEGKCIRDITIPDERLYELVTDVMGMGFVCEYHNSFGDFILEEQYEAFREISDRTQAQFPPDSERLLLLPEPVKKLTDIHDIEKIMFLGNSTPTEEVKRRWEDRYFFLPVSFPCSERYGGEITSLSVNKGAAAEALANHLGITADHLIGVGDGDNDIELIQACGTGIAMGNGTVKLREAADYVTDRIENDGFFKAFVHLGLLEEERK